jgi:hypothetical protein
MALASPPATGDDGPGGNGNWNNRQDPDNSGNEGDGDYQRAAAAEQGSQLDGIQFTVFPSREDRFRPT